MASYCFKVAPVDAFRLPRANEDMNWQQKDALHKFMGDTEWESGRDGTLSYLSGSDWYEAQPGNWLVRAGGILLHFEDHIFLQLFAPA